MTTFSIITVTYENLSGLKKTGASIQGQTCTDFEWIVIDGGSQDTSVDYLKTTNAKFVSEPDNGIYDAMNKGIDRASGDYILFLNAGDIFAAPETLEKLTTVTALKPAFIYGDALEETNSQPAYKTARSHKSIARGMFTHHQAMLYARKEIGDMRYNENYKIAADYDFTARFLRETTDRALYFRSPLCLFESGGVSQTQTALGRHEQFKIRKTLKLCRAIFQ